MTVKQLTSYENNRLKQCKCLVCNEKIKPDSIGFIMIKRRRGRSIEYQFIHNSCVEKCNTNFSSYILASSQLEVKN